ncbi:MAG: glycosyltransferase family 4 protein [Chloroflexi bacterium]|nr:glycosyltransferase family 4 protein [Chloroflexota bacterium]
MKIALVSPYDIAYPGGVAHHIAALERHFTRWGHDVRIISPTSRQVNHLADRVIPIGKPRPIPTGGTVIRVATSLHLAPDIKAVMAREQFDIVHLHEPFMPMLCSAVLRFSNTVNIGTFHACGGKPGYNFAWPIGRIMLERRQRKLHGKIAVSPVAQAFAQKYVHGPYAVIPNGIDVRHFTPEVPPLPEFRDGKLNILFVGRLEGRKGLIYLLKAYRAIKRDLPATRLIVVGPGNRLRKKYERWVNRNRLEDVVFAGYADYDELPGYYASADVFCAPATGRESFGIVLVEAMAAGKPVIASDIAGYRCVLDHGTQGLLVPPKDERGLAQALMTLLTNNGLRQQMGERGRQKAQGFEWERVARRVLDYYVSVLSDRGKEDFAAAETIPTPVFH